MPSGYSRLGNKSSREFSARSALSRLIFWSRLLQQTSTKCAGSPKPTRMCQSTKKFWKILSKAKTRLRLRSGSATTTLLNKKMLDLRGRKSCLRCNASKDVGKSKKSTSKDSMAISPFLRRLMLTMKMRTGRRVVPSETSSLSIMSSPKPILVLVGTHLLLFGTTSLSKSTLSLRMTMSAKKSCKKKSSLSWNS